MKNDGWVKLHRSLFSDEWEWYGDANTTYLFIALISLANHQEGNWHGKTVPRGSLITGRKALSKKLGISEQSIRTSLTKLKSTNKITSQSTNEYTVISIKNYNEYQPINQPINKRVTNDQPTTNHKQEEQEGKEEQEESVHALAKNKYSSLSDITDTDLQEIADDYQVTLPFVRSCLDSFTNWLSAKGRVMKNYKAALRNWVKADALKVRKEQIYAKGKPNIIGL